MIRDEAHFVRSTQRLARSFRKLGIAFGVSTAVLQRATVSIAQFTEDQKRRDQWQELKIAVALFVAMHIGLVGYLWR